MKVHIICRLVKYLPYKKFVWVVTVQRAIVRKGGGDHPGGYWLGGNCPRFLYFIVIAINICIKILIK